jgi:aminoglycoside N3'-acetyltransferase
MNSSGGNRTNDKLGIIKNDFGCATELEESKECQFTYRYLRMCRDSTQKLKNCIEKQQKIRAEKIFGQRKPTTSSKN